MSTKSYQEILLEMQESLTAFSHRSSSLNAYTYEKEFRAITDKYNQLLFQASIGKVPRSKNESGELQTGFGNVKVKKKDIR